MNQRVVRLIEQRRGELRGSYEAIVQKWLEGRTQSELGGEYCPGDVGSIGENVINRIIKLNCPGGARRRHNRDTHRRTYLAGHGAGGLTREVLTGLGRSLAVSNGYVPYDIEKIVDTGSGRFTLPEYVGYLKSRNFGWGEITRLTNVLFRENRTPNQLKMRHHQKWAKKG